MVLNDPLASALSRILSRERIGKRVCTIKPMSNMIKAVLDVMRDNMYIGAYSIIKDGKGGKIELQLLARINGCGAIKPRFSVKKDRLEEWEKRYLPSKDFGILIISTPRGIMTNAEAKAKGFGGKLLAFVY